MLRVSRKAKRKLVAADPMMTFEINKIHDALMRSVTENRAHLNRIFPNFPEWVCPDEGAYFPAVDGNIGGYAWGELNGFFRTFFVVNGNIFYVAYALFDLSLLYIYDFDALDTASCDLKFFE